MSDLYEMARPVRDAALAEHRRMVAQLNINPDAEAANALGIHLSAIVMAFVADRCKTLEGNIPDQGLQGILAAAVAMAIGNWVVNFRPIIDGAPLPPSVNAHIQLQRIVQETFRQVACAETGLQDFNIQFQTAEDGSLSEKSFDFAKMMKGQS